MKTTNDNFYIFLDIDGVMVNGHNLSADKKYDSIIENHFGILAKKRSKFYLNWAERYSQNEVIKEIELMKVGSEFNDDAVQNFNTLKYYLEKLGHNVNLVISSARRHFHEPGEMYRILEYAGVDCGNQIDYTTRERNKFDIHDAEKRELNLLLHNTKPFGKGFEILEYLASRRIGKNQFCVIDDEVSSIAPVLNMHKLKLPYSPIINTSVAPDTFVPINADRGREQVYLQEGHVKNFITDYITGTMKRNTFSMDDKPKGTEI